MDFCKHVRAGGTAEERLGLQMQLEPQVVQVAEPGRLRLYADSEPCLTPAELRRSH